VDGVIMSSKTVKKKYRKEKLVRWDPITARFEEYKLKN
jgi:hypothetical protein